MKYLPFENYILHSPLSVNELRFKISSKVEPDRFRFFWESSRASYQGIVYPDGFEIRRIITHRNSFLPVIKAQFNYEESGSSIHIKMRMQRLVIVFMAIWLGAAGIIGITIMVAQLIRWEFEPFTFVPLGMFGFGYALVMGGFKYESENQRNFYLNYLKLKR